MLNRPFRASHDRPDVDESGESFDYGDLQRVGCALVQLDAWCRQRGLNDLAALIEFAADWADARLTQR